MTGNDWEARQRDCGTTRRRDHGTTGLRDCGTTGQRDHGTTGQRDNGTTEKHRRSQAFSVVLSRARLREAAWRQSGADVVPSRSLAGWGCTCAYIPIQTNELGAADAPLSRQAITPSAWCQKGAECYTRQKCRRWVVLRRTSH